MIGEGRIVTVETHELVNKLIDKAQVFETHWAKFFKIKNKCKLITSFTSSVVSGAFISAKIMPYFISENENMAFTLSKGAALTFFFSGPISNYLSKSIFNRVLEPVINTIDTKLGSYMYSFQLNGRSFSFANNIGLFETIIVYNKASIKNKSELIIAALEEEKMHTEITELIRLGANISDFKEEFQFCLETETKNVLLNSWEMEKKVKNEHPLEAIKNVLTVSEDDMYLHNFTFM